MVPEVRIRSAPPESPFRGNQYYLIDILREKLDYPHLKKKVIEHAQLHHADVVIIENKGSGMVLNVRYGARSYKRCDVPKHCLLRWGCGL